MISEIDMIYIINLEKNVINLKKSLISLKNIGCVKYTVMNAVNTITENEDLYNNTINNMTEEFKNNNFNRGALGCLLSHVKCAKHALEGGYKKIIVLEDDFILVHNFIEKYNKCIVHIPEDWDFVYLGKKQGYDCPFDYSNTIHTNMQHDCKNKYVNNYFYEANYRTWATHALMINSTIFNDIINIEKNIYGPIDLMLMTLYDNNKFYVVENDLIISDDSHSDIMQKEHRWNWCEKLYQKIKIVEIDKFIIYGFKTGHHTHNYIHEMFYDFLKHYYPHKNVYWFDTYDTIDEELLKNAYIFYSPTHAIYTKPLYNSSCHYLIHLDNHNNCGYKSVYEFFDDEQNKIFLINKNYTIFLCREDNNIKYFEKQYDKQTICLPWFSNTIYNNIKNIGDNLETFYDLSYNNTHLMYFGSIWSLNIKMIIELINCCEQNKIKLLLRGRIFDLTNEQNYSLLKKYNFVTVERFDYENDENNNFNILKNKYSIRSLLPLQGDEHIGSYMSNRIFESIAKGYLSLSNNKTVKQYFKSVIYNENIEELILYYIHILNNKDLWIEKMKEQVNELLNNYYGQHIINECLLFSEKIEEQNKKMMLINHNNHNNLYELLFTHDNKKNYNIIKNNTDIIQALKNPKNSIIINDISTYDPYMVKQIVTNYNYKVCLTQKNTIVRKWCDEIKKNIKYI